MDNNALKTPFAATINRFAERKISEHFNLGGKALPASVVTVVKNGFVTIKFELVNTDQIFPQVTVPVAESVYVRLPIQPGDKGVVRPIDAYLGGVSGLGGGSADLTRPANLSALVFEPVANTVWPACDNQSVVIQGPNGVFLADQGGRCAFTLTPGGLTITVGGNTWTFNASGLTQTGGDSVVNNVSATHHGHPDPQGGVTGAPIPA